MKFKLPRLKKPNIHLPGKKGFLTAFFALALIGALAYTSYFFVTKYNYDISTLQKDKSEKESRLEEVQRLYDELKNVDQLKRNEALQEEIENIEKIYKTAVTSYEELLKLKEKTDKTESMDELFSKALSLLSERKWKDASDTLSELDDKIDTETKKIVASFTIPQNVSESNAPPRSGYSRQRVVTDAGTFMVSIIAAELGSTRVIVDTAADSDCGNDCPVLPLATYVSRNGAYAGVNGSYFCPATYPTCAGKTNTFDLLVMNKNKTYFNSDNNVYSNNPAVVFGDNYIRFLTAASQWGRDTGPNGVLSNYPMLVFNGNIMFGGDDDPKKGSKGARSFVANKGNTVYIGVAHNVTVAESARVMKTLGMENAMNLDDGGSTALWSGGYKVGPGRNLPNVILFVRK
jgi:hypothetical protein